MLYLSRLYISIISLAWSGMSNKQNPFRVNVGLLLNQVVGYSRDFHFDFQEIELPPDLVVKELSGLSRINRTPQGLLVNGEFTAIVELECVRCLENYKQTLTTTFDELYAFNERTATDSGLILPDDGYIDLRPLIREYLLIEFPISPLCKIDCRGLCAICGINRNKSSCEHEETSEKPKR